MFTGIIEEIGTVKRVDRKGETMVLAIGAAKVLEDAALGDSIAVNGVCLTVTTLARDGFTMDVMPETFRHTNLKELKPGDRVNLERAMSARGRFGGHIVQGHVDCTASITGRQPAGNAVVFTFRPHDPEVLKYMIPRGSVTLDGISLTLIAVGDDRFQVSIIPHTLRETVLGAKYPGDTVNVEADVTGKYIYRYMEKLTGGIGRGEGGAGPGRHEMGLTLRMLEEHGFLT